MLKYLNKKIVFDISRLIVYRRLTIKRGFTMIEKSISQPDQNPAPDFEPEAFALLCKALCHPARLRIIEYLKQENRCVCGKIVDVLPLAQSTVSQHLKILKEADLIRGEVDGPRICYCLNQAVFNQFKKMALDL
jgi:ArsR family transcriptional regulator